jgi:predicted Zn-dependent protease
MRSLTLVLVTVVPVSVLAQGRPPAMMQEAQPDSGAGYPPPDRVSQNDLRPPPAQGQNAPAPPQQAQPQPAQNPQNGQYPAQAYPQTGYPPPSGQYPQNGYPPPQNYPQTQTQAAPPAPRPTGRLALSTHSREVAGLVTDCANAIDNDHLDIAQKKCRDALAKDDSLAFAHYLAAQAEPPDVAAKELQRAAELARQGATTRGEKLFIDAYRAAEAGRLDDARRLYDELVRLLSSDARALVARGRFRHEALGDAASAAGDFQKVIALDAKYPAAYGLLGAALADAGKLDDAQAAIAKYGELAPKEPNAAASAARLALRRGALDEAITQAKKSLALDPKFPPALAALGDALQFAGKGRDARRAYAALIACDDAAVHHDGAMRDARSFLFDNRNGDAERALVAEADFAGKTKRAGDQADALVELARMQLDRGAVSEAGQSLRQSRTVLEAAATAVSERQRQQLLAEGLHVRAMVLGAIGERQLAEARADESGAALKLAGDPHAGKQATALKGWIAARNGDDKNALAELAEAERPTLRMALALAASRAGDGERARSVMEELAKRNVNDLEGALTRSRAQAWLKTHPSTAAPSNAAAPSATPAPASTSAKSVVL